MRLSHKILSSTTHLITLLLLASHSFAQESLVVGRTQIGFVNFGHQSLAVLPETQNYLGDTPNFPGRWEFSVDPILMPEFDDGGQVKLVIGENFKTYSKVCCGGTATDYSTVTRIGIPLILSNEAVFQAAAKAVTEHFADLKYEFKISQIATIPLDSLTVNFPDLTGGPCLVENATIPVTSSQPRTYIWIDCTDTVRGHPPKPPEMKAVQHLKSTLPNLNVTLIKAYDVRSADIGGTNVVVKSVKQTSLYAKLNGDGGQTMLVTRDDLRKLAMTAAQELYADYRGVRSPRCSGDFVSDVMDHFKEETRIEAGKFTPEMLKTTYNPHDVDPDEVQKTFDKNIQSSSSKDQVNISAGGGVSFLGFGANGNMSGNYFTEKAASSDVEAEWNGTKWIAKSVKVLQVNISDFATNYHASCSDFSVGVAQQKASKTLQLIFRGDNWQDAPTVAAEAAKTN
jgi:hypothetical protein